MMEKDTEHFNMNLCARIILIQKVRYATPGATQHPFGGRDIATEHMTHRLREREVMQVR